jgi:hypothetical protein
VPSELAREVDSVKVDGVRARVRNDATGVIYSAVGQGVGEPAPRAYRRREAFLCRAGKGGRDSDQSEKCGVMRVIGRVRQANVPERRRGGERHPNHGTTRLAKTIRTRDAVAHG